MKNPFKPKRFCFIYRNKRAKIGRLIFFYTEEEANTSKKDYEKLGFIVSKLAYK